MRDFMKTHLSPHTKSTFQRFTASLTALCVALFALLPAAFAQDHKPTSPLLEDNALPPILSPHKDTEHAPKHKHHAHAQDEDGFSSPALDTSGLDYNEMGRLKIWSTPHSTKGFLGVAERSQDDLKRIQTLLGSEDGHPIRVLVVEDLNDYFKRTNRPPRAPEWAIGLAISSESTVLIKWGRAGHGAWVDMEKTFVHELAHIALDRAVGTHEEHAHSAQSRRPADPRNLDGPVRKERRVPRWLHEAFAIEAAAEWNLERSNSVLQASALNHLIPMVHLRNRFPASGPSVELAYAQSYSFLQYLHGTYGQTSFQTMIQRLQQGDRFETAFEGAYGRSFATEEATWRGEITASGGWLYTALGSTSAMVFGGLLLIAAWRRKRREKQERMEEITWRERAMHTPSSPLPGLGLSQEDTQQKPWRVLRDGTLVMRNPPLQDPRDPAEYDAHEDLYWGQWNVEAMDHGQVLSTPDPIPRTEDGYTIH